MAVYAIPDLHGCLKTFQLLIEDKLKVSKCDTVFLLGDYIDRGPSSAQLIEYIVELKDSNYNIICLKGNHEKMMLDSTLDYNYYNLWMANYGINTLISYATFLNIDFKKVDIDQIPIQHKTFFHSLCSYYIYKDLVLVHGGLDYRESDPFSDENTLLWKRPEPIPDWFLPGKKIIFGHTPTAISNIKNSIKNPANRLIGLDAGCVYKGINDGLGYLVSLDLENWKITSVENID